MEKECSLIINPLRGKPFESVIFGPDKLFSIKYLILRVK